jgi:hypothetical protein
MAYPMGSSQGGRSRGRARGERGGRRAGRRRRACYAAPEVEGDEDHRAQADGAHRRPLAIPILALSRAEQKGDEHERVLVGPRLPAVLVEDGEGQGKDEPEHKRRTGRARHRYEEEARAERGEQDDVEREAQMGQELGDRRERIVARVRQPQPR